MSIPRHPRLPHTAVALCCIVMHAVAAVAQPGLDAAARKVETLAAKTAASDPADRATVLEETIRARRELIALGAADDRLATWLLDQADALLQHAGRDGAEFSVLYGIPLGEQRTRMRDAASEAATLIDRAAAAIDAGVAKLEGDLFAARDNPAKAREVSARVEPRLKILVDLEQSWRLPMMHARTAVVRAASLDTGAPAQRALAREAAAALDELRGPDETAELARLLWHATALMLAGERFDAGHHFAEVEPLGADKLEGEQARLGLAVAAMDLVAAREAARLLARGSDDAPLPLALIRAEAVARGILTHAPTGDTRAAVQREGLLPLARVMQRALRADASIRTLVIEKIVVATDPSAPWGVIDVKQMDPAIVFARGIAFLAARPTPDIAKPSPGERSTTPQELLLRVADGDASPELKEASLWALGSRTGLEKAPHADRLAAAGHLVRLARDFPASAHVPAAIERADALLRLPAAEKFATALPLQRELVELALQRTPPPGNADELRSVYLANHALDDALALDAEALDRFLQRGAPASRDELPAADETNIWIVAERAISHAKLPRSPIAQVILAWSVPRSSAITARARLALAVALLEENKAVKSIEAIAALGDLNDSPLSAADRIRARLTLGRAQRAAADPNAAFATLRALADDLDRDSASTPKRIEAFWAAWAELLEILRAQNTAGDRTPTIRLQLNRLQLIDADFGGEPWRSRINAVGDSLK